MMKLVMWVWLIGNIINVRQCFHLLMDSETTLTDTPQQQTPLI